MENTIFSLNQFWENYKCYVQKLNEENFRERLTERQIYLLDSLNKYLKETGFNKIDLTLNLEIVNSDKLDEERIKGFIEAYQYLIQASENNFENLIDILFALPCQFDRDLKK